MQKRGLNQLRGGILIFATIVIVLTIATGFLWFGGEDTTPPAAAATPPAAHDVLPSFITARYGGWKCARVPGHLYVDWWGKDPRGDWFSTKYIDPDGNEHLYTGGTPDMRGVCFRSNVAEEQEIVLMYEHK